MAKHEIRQTSVVQGAGPGSLSVLQEGLSVIVSGVDAWYRKPITVAGDADDGIPSMIKIQDIPQKCRLNDPKLEATLGVKFFAVPPALGVDSENKHTESIPVSVFPSWSICYNCRSLSQLRPDEPYLPFCEFCKVQENKRRKVVQVTFIIACERGHIDEFPWRLWVHKGEKASCSNSRLIMETSGSGDLRGQRVTCTGCKATRTLAGTNEAEEGKSTLTEKLYGDSDQQFLCPGNRPWLDDSQECSLSVRMVLRSASNLYYSISYSSILVPPQATSEHPLDELMDEHYQSIKTKLFFKSYNYAETSALLKYEINSPFEPFELSEIENHLKNKFPNAGEVEIPDGETISSTLKDPEWSALSTPQENRNLRVRSVEYSGSIDGVSLVHAVPTLVKTTALAGFTRIMPKAQPLGEGKELLRRNPHTTSAQWLPAVQYVGEGIFIKLDDEKLKTWEQQPAMQPRLGVIQRNLEQYGRSNPDEAVTPRRVLLHTLAHVLIQELVLECGYIAASLSERIYADEEYAGILIYTSSPDSDGTMGGLVEMANPVKLGEVFANALAKAAWCSNDPVCMEAGKEGQGNLGTNLAACHSCCLLPETACEHFNQSLDRAMLIGDLTDAEAFSGYFS
jgi:hypothetical protein